MTDRLRFQRRGRRAARGMAARQTVTGASLAAEDDSGGVAPEPWEDLEPVALLPFSPLAWADRSRDRPADPLRVRRELLEQRLSRALNEEDGERVLRIAPERAISVSSSLAQASFTGNTPPRRRRAARARRREPLRLARRVVADEQRAPVAGVARLDDDRAEATDLPPLRVLQVDLDADTLEARASLSSKRSSSTGRVP